MKMRVSELYGDLWARTSSRCVKLWNGFFLILFQVKTTLFWRLNYGMEWEFKKLLELDWLEEISWDLRTIWREKLDFE
jgi:hypothetical protein